MTRSSERPWLLAFAMARSVMVIDSFTYRPWRSIDPLGWLALLASKMYWAAWRLRRSLLAWCCLPSADSSCARPPSPDAYACLDAENALPCGQGKATMVSTPLECRKARVKRLVGHAREAGGLDEGGEWQTGRTHHQVSLADGLVAEVDVVRVLRVGHVLVLGVELCVLGLARGEMDDRDWLTVAGPSWAP